MKAIGGYAGESAIVKDDDAIGALSETTEGQEGVVRVCNNVTTTECVREDGVCLNDFLRESIVHPLEYKGSQAASSSAGYRMEKHESLYRIEG